MKILKIILSGILVLVFTYCTLAPRMLEGDHTTTSHHEHHAVGINQLPQNGSLVIESDEGSSELCCGDLVSVQPKGEWYHITLHPNHLLIAKILQPDYPFSSDSQSTTIYLIALIDNNWSFLQLTGNSYVKIK